MRLHATADAVAGLAHALHGRRWGLLAALSRDCGGTSGDRTVAREAVRLAEAADDARADRCLNHLVALAQACDRSTERMAA